MNVDRFTRTKRPGSKWRFSLKDRVKFFMDAGLSYGRIGDKLGISTKRVSVIAKRLRQSSGSRNT